MTTPADALRSAAVFGEYFASAARGRADWLRLADVCTDPAPVRTWVEATRQALADRGGTGLDAVDERAAASIWFLGCAARIVSAPFGATVLSGTVPRLVLEHIWIRGSGPVCYETVATGTDLHDDVVQPALGPLLDTVAREFAMSKQVLRGNVASGLAGAASVVRSARPALGARADAMLAGVLRGELLRDAGRLTGAGFRRRNCCLYYRLPGGGLCGDCVLRDDSRLPVR